jgi:hypothetical protein
MDRIRTSRNAKHYGDSVNFFAVQNNKKANFTPSIIQDIYYAFIYRDLSKEAIMALAKGLVF